jgi:small conductance mechanosensitive channel
MENILQTLKIVFENHFFQAFLIILIFLLIIKIINSIVSGIVDKIINKTKEGEGQKQLATFKVVAISIIDTVLCILGLLHILNFLGVDIRPFLATAGVAGVAIGFGAKNVVEDVITGILILISNQIMVGDDVKIGDSRGIVEEINLRMVILRDFHGAVHYIRNSLIGKLINYTRNFSYAVFDVEVAYKENIGKVMDVLKNLGEEIKENKEYKHKILGNIENIGLKQIRPAQSRLNAVLKLH